MCTLLLEFLFQFFQHLQTEVVSQILEAYPVIMVIVEAPVKVFQSCMGIKLIKKSHV